MAVEEAVKEQDNGVMMVVETYLEGLKIREMERMFEEQLRYSINKVGDDMRKHYTKV